MEYPKIFLIFATLLLASCNSDKKPLNPAQVKEANCFMKYDLIKAKKHQTLTAKSFDAIEANNSAKIIDLEIEYRRTVEHICLEYARCAINKIDIGLHFSNCLADD